MSAYHRKAAKTELEAQIRKSGLKKGWIAEQLGVHKDTFSLWCVGKIPVPDDYLPQIVAILQKAGVDTSAEEIRAVNGHPRTRGRPRHAPAAGALRPPARPPPRIPGESLLDGATLARGAPPPAKPRKKKRRRSS